MAQTKKLFPLFDICSQNLHGLSFSSSSLLTTATATPTTTNRNLNPQPPKLKKKKTHSTNHSQNLPQNRHKTHHPNNPNLNLNTNPQPRSSIHGLNQLNPQSQPTPTIVGPSHTCSHRDQLDPLEGESKKER